MRRVGITGIGIVSPLGNDLGGFWEALITGRSGIRHITRFDASDYACKIAGEVDDLQYEQFLEPRILRTTPHVIRLALVAVDLALRDARNPRCAPEDLGVCAGTAMAGLREGEQQYGILLERGARRVNPFLVSASPSHGLASIVAAHSGASGEHFTFASGCPASLQAIAHGALLISSGRLDVCLAGGSESPLIPTTFAALSRTNELCREVDEPARACRPFSRDHSGMVLSEGGCFVVLEPLEYAYRRGVSPYAEIVGSSSSCDAMGMYAMDMSGVSGARSIQRALAASGLAVSDINYVCANANSSPAFDRKEVAVLNRAFEDLAPAIPVSSIKSVLGHPFGASGAFQVAASALAIKHSTIPPTHNLEVADPDCNLDCIPLYPRSSDLHAVLVTSYGYGGVNSCLVLRNVN